MGAAPLVLSEVEGPAPFRVRAVCARLRRAGFPPPNVVAELQIGPPNPLTLALMVESKSTFGGAVAQLGARLDGIEEVVGSNPIGSTKFTVAHPFRDEGFQAISDRFSAPSRLGPTNSPSHHEPRPRREPPRASKA